MYDIIVKDSHNLHFCTYSFVCLKKLLNTFKISINHFFIIFLVIRYMQQESVRTSILKRQNMPEGNLGYPGLCRSHGVTRKQILLCVSGDLQCIIYYLQSLAASISRHTSCMTPETARYYASSKCHKLSDPFESNASIS